MKSNIFILMTVLSLLKTGCNQNSSAESELLELDPVAETYEANALPEIENSEYEIIAEPTPVENLKIIKNANCRFKVADVDSATSEVRLILSKYDGYIAEMRLRNTRYQLENRLNLKIPAIHFEAVLQELSEISEYIDFKNISTTDVSEEYVDLQTRLKTKIVVKERYDEILRSKAKTVKEVLMAEEKLRVLQEEIEAAQGRLKFLSNRVAMSTVQLDIYQTVEHREQPDSYTHSFSSRMKDSLLFGWEMIQKAFLGILYIWPLLVIGIGVFIFIKYKKDRM